jgi:transcriptional regulator with XRE-family HTH domain
MRVRNRPVGVMNHEFGTILKKLRIKAGFGLRRFAELIEMQPSNLSALENGRRRPPTDEEKLRLIAETLGLADGSDEWAAIFDAARRNGSLPADLRHVTERKLVPVLLRTIDNCQLNNEQIANLIKEIEERHKR